MVTSSKLENFSTIPPRDDSTTGPAKDEASPDKKKSKKEVVDFLFSLIQTKTPSGIQDSLRSRAKEIVDKYTLSN
jgi:hypothetical protein